mgnify:CR=1 FL=1
MNFQKSKNKNKILLNDEIQEFVNKEMSNVVLSIDGRKEIHDKMRPFRGGQGSYDIVIPKYQKLADSRDQMNYYVRGTFTRNNLDFAEDVLHLADLGFEQISVEPVVAQESEEYAIREEDIPKIKEEYDKLAVELLKRRKEGKGVKHWLNDISLKTHAEVAAKGKAFAKKNLWKLNVAHISGLAYSAITLGYLLPMINDKMTKMRAQKQG